MIAGLRVVRLAGAGSGGEDASGVGLAVVVTGVASSLRAGNSPVDAWRTWRVRQAPDGTPLLADLARAGATKSTARRRFPLLAASHKAARTSPAPARSLADNQAAAVATICAIADELGSPLAAVLDEAAESIRGHEQASHAREGALAGPRMSARVLMWLPLATCGLGTLFGARPWLMLFDGGVGSLCLLAGGVVMAVGRAWVDRLIRRAGAPDAAGDTRETQ